MNALLKIQVFLGIYKFLILEILPNTNHTFWRPLSLLEKVMRRKIFSKISPKIAVILFTDNSTRNIIVYKKCARPSMLREINQIIFTFPAEIGNCCNKYQERNTTNHPASYHTYIYLGF